MGNLAHALIADDVARFAMLGWRNSLSRAVLECGTEMDVAPLTFGEGRCVVRNALVWHQRLRDFKIRQCFYNSQFVALNQVRRSLEYCEGFYASEDLPFAAQHAWLRINGKVVDLTARNRGERRGFDYFGVVVPVELLRRHVMKTKFWSPVLEGPFSLKFFQSLGVEMADGGKPQPVRS